MSPTVRNESTLVLTARARGATDPFLIGTSLLFSSVEFSAGRSQSVGRPSVFVSLGLYELYRRARSISYV